MRNILNLIVVIIVTVVLTMGSCIVIPEFVPSVLIIGLIALSVMFTMLIFMCKHYRHKVKSNGKHYRALHNNLQETIIAREKSLHGIADMYHLVKVQQVTDQKNINALLNLISDLTNEVEEGKDMINDLTTKK